MKLHNTSLGMRRSQVAMTLLEIMVAVTLLSLIVLTLYNMFDRTQKALRGTRNQSDIAETGRAGMDTLVRELQQMRAINSPNLFSYNLYVHNPFSSLSLVVSNATTALQTNILLEVFFHNFVRQSSPTNWAGIGYRVGSSSDPRLPPANGVGTLYRFVTNAARLTPNFMFNYSNATYNTAILPAPTNYFQRVCDGVIHFNVNLYTNGAPVTSVTYPYTLLDTQMVSHVEVELGILPPSVIEQAQAFPLAADQMSFLANKGDRVQMFRQLVPIQTTLR